MARVPRTGLSPAAARLSRRLPLPSLLPSSRPYNPARASTPAVWAGPLSLAATRGVTLVFLSSAYLDVSVRRVRLTPQGDAMPAHGGLPHSDTCGSVAVRASPQTFALASRSSVSTRSLVSVFLPSCQRTAQGESLLRVENVGLEPTTPGLQSRCSSQLSQSPRRVVPGRLELPTPTLSVWCSNQLSYGTPAPAEDPETRPAALAACAPSVFSLSVCSGQHRRRLLRDLCGNPPERRCSSRTFRYGYLVTT